MGYAVYDLPGGRFGGYGVPAKCDHPDCDTDINRGLDFVCGSEPRGENGCGLYFCHEHLGFLVTDDGDIPGAQNCDRCIEEERPFDPKPEVAEWVNHMLTDESWQQWRDENPDEVAAMRAAR